MNMNTPSQARVRYHAAVVLNNIGVALLEKSCYRQGMETLRDAAGLLASYFRNKEGIAYTDFDSTPNCMLNEAKNRLVNSESSCIRPVALLDVVIRDADSLPDSADTLLLPRSGPCHTIIRIEDSDLHSDSINGETFYYEAAIALHNLGVAYACMFAAVRCNLDASSRMRQRARRYSEAAAKIFRYSHAMMTMASVSTPERLEDTMFLHIMFLGLSSLTQSLHELNRLEDAKQVYCLLADLRVIIHDVEKQYRDMGARRTTAAAA